MKILGKLVFLVSFVLITVVLLYVVVRFYPYVFSRTIVGKVEAVERVQPGVTVNMNPGAVPNPGVFSFAIAVRTEDGTIFTASAEDRQWAVVQKGQCVEARLYRYPPWNLDKSGTWFNARLDRLFDCP